MTRSRLNLLAVSVAVAAVGGLAAVGPARAPRAAAPPARPVEKTLAVGDKVVTGPGQRRRVVLGDGTVVYIRERSALEVKDGGHVALTAGEAFFEAGGALKVSASKRSVTARASRFGVRVGEEGDAVLVASGQARVDGLEGPVRAGQRLEAGAKAPAAAPRISHLVAWTRELRPAAPLVPASEHAGGTLIARDPDGQEAKLELRRFKVDVHVEDGFARTTIDQTYFNHSEDRLEGTFRFPLPPDASLSRLAMYVDGKLMEGGMVERDEARGIYERILYQQRDPALLEWVDGSTFKMRVFPLEGRQEKRLVLSYTQRLPWLYGQTGYRFPAGHSLTRVGEWSLNVRVKDGAALAWQCPSHELKAAKEGGDLVLGARLKDAPLDRDVVVNLTEAVGQGDEARFASAELDGHKFLMVRYRPAMAGAAAAARRDWVILVEASADRDPVLMRTQVEVVRSLLDHAGRDDTFTVVTAATRVRKLNARPAVNGPEAVAEAVTGLEKAHCVGALDLGQALDEARPLLEAAQAPHLLHVGSGVAAMGPAKTEELLKKLPKGARYVGVGVGKRWNRAFMQAAAEATGGYFTQVSPDEDVTWRGFDLLMTLNTPRLMDVEVSDKAGRTAFLPFVRLVSQGEEVAAVARVTGEVPRVVLVKGRVDGREVVRELPVRGVKEKAGYLPRSWAKLEVDRLLALDAAKNKEAIIALSKAMYVMTPYTSLLVLENEDMYKQFKVDRGRKDHWAMYPAPATIKVVTEPVGGEPGDPKKGVKPAPRVVRQTLLVRGAPEALRAAEGGAAGYETTRRRLALQTWSEAAPVTSGGAAPFGLGVERASLPAGATSLGRMPRMNSGALEAERGAPWDRPSQGLAFHPPRFAFRDVDKSANAPGESREGEQLLKRLSDRTSRVADELGRVEEFSNAYRLMEGRREPASRTIETAGLRSRQYSVPGRGAGWEVEAPASLLYGRPRYAGSDAVYFDLLSYAPGLNTTSADLDAVLAEEARLTPANRPGKVGEGVRELFDRARGGGWRSLTVPATRLASAYRITFDGAGRYAWERALPSGLRERAVCDGKTLWHLYPELGLAARRSVSAAHREAFARLVPWALPRPEDLARGADVVRLSANVVAVVPAAREGAKGKAGPAVHEHYIFRDGRLAERAWVLMPARKVLLREAYTADGTVQTVEPKAAAETWKGELADAKGPDLTADVKGLVVVDLPYREPGHVYRTLQLEKRRLEELTFSQARRLLVAYVAAGNGSAARDVFQRSLASRDERPIGYYVLLASAGVNLDGDNLDVMGAHPEGELAQYLALYSSPVLRKNASRWAAASNAWKGGLLRRLALGHALCQRWSSAQANGGTAAGRKAERGRALGYVKQHAGTALAWGLLGLVQERTAELKDGEERKGAYAELAAAYGLFTDAPGLGEYAEYEQARCHWHAGAGGEARKRFDALAGRARKAGGVLPIDGDFRAAFVAGEGSGGWAPRLREEARALVKGGRRYDVLRLAWQCWQLDDPVMARHLFGEALRGVSVKGEGDLELQVAALGLLMRTNQGAEAEGLVERLLGDADNAKRPGLWRVAAKLAGDRDRPARQLMCLEKALELEYADLPPVFNLSQVREDYGRLLGQYDSLAKSLVTLKLDAPAGFRDKVVRAADRWRSLDADQERASRLAASTLRALGDRDVAWEYMTTPIALRPGESDVWVSLASSLAQQGERDLADRAYQAAFEREGSNAQVLWDRAENLRQAGRSAAARKVYEQIATGSWQPRFAGLKQQARWALEGK